MNREEPSHEVIAFYSATLPAVIGHDFQDVPIDLLLSWYNSGDCECLQRGFICFSFTNPYVSASIRHAVRLLLETRLARMNDQDLMHLADIQIGHREYEMQPSSVSLLMVAGILT